VIGIGTPIAPPGISFAHKANSFVDSIASTKILFLFVKNRFEELFFSVDDDCNFVHSDANYLKIEERGEKKKICKVFHMKNFIIEKLFAAHG